MVAVEALGPLAGFAATGEGPLLRARFAQQLMAEARHVTHPPLGELGEFGVHLSC